MQLSRIQHIRDKVSDSSLNDTFIYGASGAVGKYFAHKGELPAC